MEFNVRKFCERLKELRKENNLSTTKLGVILKVSQSTIVRWENGLILPSICHLYKMAKFFDVTADYLIGLED